MRQQAEEADKRRYQAVPGPLSAHGVILHGCAKGTSPLQLPTCGNNCHDRTFLIDQRKNVPDNSDSHGRQPPSEYFCDECGPCTTTCTCTNTGWRPVLTTTAMIPSHQINQSLNDAFIAAITRKQPHQATGRRPSLLILTYNAAEQL